MRRLSRRQRRAAIVLTALAACLLTLDLGAGGLRSAHSGIRGVLGALYRGTDGVLGPARRFVQGVPSAGTNQARVRALQHENAVLRAQLAARAADRATQAQLGRLQLAADSGGYGLVPARVIALGPGQGFDWTVTLDVGTKDGVRVGQTVTDGGTGVTGGTGALVGRVLLADTASSVVLLGADPGSGIGVRDLRTGDVGVATGRGSAGFTFTPLNPNARIRVGDLLSTGPAGATSYVAGLSVGTVTSVRSSADGTTRAQVSAATSPTSLDLVGVILVGGQDSVPRPVLLPAGVLPSGTQAQR
ncbi:MAG: rod shape-determining protein MreC [Actinomycetota bacterium]|nr:rod shape-determining protein MreC [Actinomycetota bacterium]